MREILILVPADALLLLGRAQMNYTFYILRDAVSFATSTNMLYEDRSIYLADVLHVLYAIYPMHYGQTETVCSLCG